ncbi:hypothetical protein ACPOM7_11400 [Peribacillus castrilensis]|uniref:Uncharacterized protein n=1 Tax=Peribacillus simplex TaxID=1478 RepID=A0AAN2TSD8_9BACI|nr:MULTISPECIES: hypothetical protein [Bacillaceae]MCP1093441.1 hypothetical protein [Bacillaceae bacterium OS4b]MBD8588603.1 hypothetical protein [Peribacillus simplex]MCF7622127.1 hypothetical protein [Peribacillus frigoritolerans]MCP1152689.1 hypothetical protein [Peribacillus frigoritolerans]MCT1388476.1 hypothetical protein [Peribacillus frigoritolerans]
MVNEKVKMNDDKRFRKSGSKNVMANKYFRKVIKTKEQCVWELRGLKISKKLIKEMTNST